jgi:hypothetical protein
MQAQREAVAAHEAAAEQLLSLQQQFTGAQDEHTRKVSEMQATLKAAAEEKEVSPGSLLLCAQCAVNCTVCHTQRAEWAWV